MLSIILDKMNMSDNALVLGIRKLIIKAIFLIKKQFFATKMHIKNNKINDLWTILWSAIFAIVPCYVIVYIVLKFDSYIIQKNNISFSHDTISLYSDIVIACIGLVGVILGLYYSNIEQIYSNRYSNTSEKLASLFRSDRTINFIINILKTHIIVSMIILFNILLTNSMGYVSCSLYLLYTICTVIVFVRKENIINALANKYSLAYNINIDILNVFDIIRDNNEIFEDNSFQDYFCKVVDGGLDLLYELSKSKDNLNKDNATIEAFMAHNLYLLEEYFNIKNRIKYNSNWYKREAKYKKWHDANYTEVKLAIATKTSMNSNEEINEIWFEERIAEINDTSLKKLCDQQDYRYIIMYLNKLTKLCNKDYTIWEITEIYELLRKVEKRITDISTNGNNDLNISDYELSMFENVILAYLNTLLSIATALQKMDLEKEINKARINISKDNFYTIPVLNNEIGFNLNKTIVTENKIEGRQITPNWYLEKNIARLYLEKFNECFEYSIKIEKVLINLSKSMYDKHLYQNSLLVLTHILELISKLNHRYIGIKNNYFSLLIKCSDSMPNHLTNLCEQYIDAIRSLEIDTFKLYRDSCIKFMETNWKSTKSKYPDFIGFYYNQTCSFLADCICQNNYKSFEAIYKEFINIVFLYYDYIRTDIVDSNVSDRYKTDRIIVPFIEYAQISGLAIIWGEISNNHCWRDLAEKELQTFYSKINSETVLEGVVEIINAKKALIMGSRDIILTEWAMNVTNMIRQSKYNVYEKDGMYSTKLRTNSELIEKYCSRDFERFGLKSDCYEVYIIECINKYLRDDKKYHSNFGWENR